MKFIKLGLTILFFGYIIYSGVFKTWGIISNDFSNYYISSQIVVHQDDLTILYNDSLFNQYVNKYGISQGSKFSQYPPLTSFIMIPLTIFDPVTAKKIWTVLNIIFLLGCIMITRNLFSLTWQDSFFLFSILGFGIINNLVFGQFYIVLLFLILFPLLLIKNQEIIPASVLLGFSVVIKIIPVIFLFWFSLHRKWKLVLISVFTILFLLISEATFFGWSISSGFWLGIFTDHLQSNLIHQSPYAFSFQSLNTLLHHLFIFDSTENQNPIFHSEILFSTFMIGVPVILAVITFRHLRKNSFKNQSVLLNESFAIFFVAFLCILPASATYHFILLALPAAVILSSNRYSESVKMILLTPIFLIGFIPINLVNSLELHGVFFILHFPRLVLLFVLFALLILFSGQRKLSGKT